ncbi:AEC family transporter [Clostridiaceae bacterium HSG29]|nr:AEC family transporter [Clostridiaceae bacterium HSG29]
MDIIYVALKTTFPLLFIMSIGYIAKVLKVFKKQEVSSINKLVYWVLLPILLFCNVYQPELYTLKNTRLLLFSIAATTVVIICAFIIVPFVIKDRSKVGVVIQGLLRGNILYFGVPVISSLLGETYVGLISIVIVGLVPIYNIVSVIALEKYSSKKVKLKTTVIKIAKNPLIISAVLGMSAVFLKIEMPILIMDSLKTVARATTAIALILLGAAIELSFTKENLKIVVFTAFTKLVIIPIIVLIIAPLIGLTKFEIITVFAVFAAPTAVASYSLAREMNADYDLAGQIVFLSTISSVITIFFGTVLLQWFHIL